MTLFALINRDLSDTGRRRHNVAAVPPGQLAPGKPYWVPVVEETSDESGGAAETVTGPYLETVEAGRILRRRVIRAKSQAELDAADDALAAAIVDQRGALRVLARVLFSLENRVRVLEGAPTVTPAQFRAALVGLIR